MRFGERRNRFHVTQSASSKASRSERRVSKATAETHFVRKSFSAHARHKRNQAKPGAVREFEAMMVSTDDACSR